MKHSQQLRPISLKANVKTCKMGNDGLFNDTYLNVSQETRKAAAQKQLAEKRNTRLVIETCLASMVKL